jgi:hypothetical protein
MQRTSFVVHLINTHDEPIPKDEVFDVLFNAFPDAYLDVREFTSEEYIQISEPETVE